MTTTLRTTTATEAAAAAAAAVVSKRKRRSKRPKTTVALVVAAHFLQCVVLVVLLLLIVCLITIPTAMAADTTTTNGDFDALNALYAGVTIVLPNVTNMETTVALGTTLTLNLTHIECSHVAIRDLDLNQSPAGSSTSTTDNANVVLLNVAGVNISCTTDYSWAYILGMDGSGSLSAVTVDNSINVQAIVTPPDSNSNTRIPQFVIDNCAAAVQVQDLTFTDGLALADTVLSTALEGLVTTVVQTQVENFLCEWIGGNATQVPLQNMFNRVHRFMEPYLNSATPPPNEEYVMAGAVEKEKLGNITSSNSSNITLLNWNYPVGTISSMIDFILLQLGNYFGQKTPDGNDLNLNVLLRQYLLNGQLPGSPYPIDIAQFVSDSIDTTTTDTSSSSSSSYLSSLQLDDAGNLILYNASNFLGNVTVKLTALQILGLDSFVSFAPLTTESPGTTNYTVYTNFTLSTIRIRMNFDLLLTAPDNTTTSTDSTASTSTSSPASVLLESVTADFALESSLSAKVAILLALNVGALEALPVGAFLNTATVLQCALSTVQALGISYIQVINDDSTNPLTLLEPTVTSTTAATSPGLVQLVQNGLDLVFTTYQNELNVFVSNLLGSQVFVNLLSNALQLLLLQSRTAATPCPVLVVPNTTNTSTSTNNNSSQNAVVVMDLRDVFLSPAESLAYGGSGTQPYGNTTAFVKELIDTQLEAVDPVTGLARVNSVVVDPLTMQQSGIAGVWDLSSGLLGDLGGGGRRDRRSLAEDTSSNGPYVLDWTRTISVLNNYTKEYITANLEFKVSHVRLERLDTIVPPVQLLQPTQGGGAYELNNQMTIGPAPTPLRVAFRMLLAITANNDTDNSIINEVDFSVEATSPTVLFTLLVKLMTQRVLQFPIRDVLNVNCWLAAMPQPVLDEFGLRTNNSEPSFALKNLDLSMDGLTFNVTCRNCTSPRIPEISRLLATSERARQDATDSARRVMNFFLRILNENDSILQTALDRLVAAAPAKCPHRAEYNESATSPEYQSFVVTDDGLGEDKRSTSFFYAVVGVMVGLAIGGLVIFIVLKVLVRRRSRNWLASLPAEQVLAILRRQEEQDQQQREINILTGTSIVRSPHVPAFVRWFMPVVIVGNIALFLSGHLSLGGTVRVDLQIAGDVIHIEDLYSFSIAESLIQLWNAGGKQLAIIMLLFSGVWPYTKQLIVMFLWLSPPERVSVYTRNSIFVWLDILGKWSMLDVFVMIVSIAAFRISIRSPNLAFLPNDLYAADITVVPMWGLYANMMAQLVSQISSHYIIHYNRRMLKVAAKAHEQQTRESIASTDAMELEQGHVPSSHSTGSDRPPSTAPRASTTGGPTPDAPTKVEQSLESMVTGPEVAEPLYKHAFTRPHRGNEEKLKVLPAVHPGLIGASVVLSVFFLVGCIVPSFSFDIEGIVGIAVESGNRFEPAIVNESVFSIARLLTNQARFLGQGKDYIGLSSIAILLVLTTLIVPLFQTGALLALWFMSLKPSARNKLEFIIEILAAWQYAEVYILAILVGVWQLGKLSAFMINEQCATLERTFATLLHYNIIRPADAQCFRVQASIEGGTFVLLAGALFLALVNTFVCTAVRQLQMQADFHHVKLNNVTEHNSKVDDEKNGEAGTPSKELSAVQKIRPVPVLFTDRFRWLLQAEA